MWSQLFRLQCINIITLMYTLGRLSLPLIKTIYLMILLLLLSLCYIPRQLCGIITYIKWLNVVCYIHTYSYSYNIVVYGYVTSYVLVHDCVTASARPQDNCSLENDRIYIIIKTHTYICKRAYCMAQNILVYIIAYRHLPRRSVSCVILPIYRKTFIKIAYKKLLNFEV